MIAILISGCDRFIFRVGDRVDIRKDVAANVDISKKDDIKLLSASIF